MKKLPTPALRLAGTLLLAAILPAFAGPNDENGESLEISGFEQPLNAEWVYGSRNTRNSRSPLTAETDPQKVKEGASSGKWSDLPKNPWITLAHCPEDWSAYTALSFWLYSENANGQAVNLIAWSPADPVGGEKPYYLHTVHVDWHGWRHLMIPLESFQPRHQPPGWSKIATFNLACSRMGAQPLPDSTLYFDAMRLIRR